MSMRLIYDKEVDVLRLLTGEDEATSSSLYDDIDIVVDLDKNEERVLGLMIIGASTYLPLGKRGYDAETDTLTLGTVATEPALITRNADFITYWMKDRYEGDDTLDPIGVAVKHASKHLAPLSKEVPQYIAV